MIKKLQKLKKLVMFVGTVTLIAKILKFLRFLSANTIRRPLDLGRRYGKKSWAFITGSSQGKLLILTHSKQNIGIGFAIAKELAGKGFNVILSGRKEDKLVSAVHELNIKYPTISADYIAIDFSQNYSYEKLLPLLERKFQDKDISILVNNVGIDVLQRFQSISYQKIETLINLNCTLMAVLNRYFIERFKKRLQQIHLRSAIVNVASAAGEIPIPIHNVYSGSKAFVDFLSRTLAYQNQEIDIISLRPAQVSTTMTFNRPPDTFLTISPQQCAKGLINDLGLQDTTSGFITHKIQGWFFSAVPEKLRNYVWTNMIAPSIIEERRVAQAM